MRSPTAMLKKEPEALQGYMPFYREPEEKHPQPGDPEAGRNIGDAMASVWNKARKRRKAAEHREKMKKGQNGRD